MKEKPLLSADSLKENYWEGRLRHYEAARTPKLGRLIEVIGLGVGLLIPTLFFIFGFHLVAYIGWGVLAVVATGSFLSPSFKKGIQEVARRFAIWVGNAFSYLILTPVYWIGFSAVRFLNWVGGRDDLILKLGAGQRSTWAATDTLKRKGTADAKMFCAETSQKDRRPFLKLAVMGLGLLVLGELIFRYKGYHDPLLYMNDVNAGYRIQPNQHVRWEGGEVFINNQGMRNREDVEDAKPANTFRILLIGDSTLYGGDYLKHEELYSHLLQEHLQKQLPPGRSVQVLSWGVNGAGPHQNAGVVQSHPHVFGSDAVVVCIPLADTTRPRSDASMSRFQLKKPTFAWRVVSSMLLSDLLLKMKTAPGQSNVKEPFIPMEEKWVSGISKYRELVTTAKAAGAEVWFQIQPQVEPALQDPNAGTITPAYLANLERFRDEMKDLVQKVDYPTSLFKGLGGLKNDNLWHDAAHMGPEGHRIYAAYLAEQIIQNAGSWKKFANSNAE